MWRLLPLFAILQIAYCTCPENLDLVKDGECRGFKARDTIMYEDFTTTAVKQCAEIDGKPMIIHNDEHQKYWHNRVPNEEDGRMVLGLACNVASTKWEWADGSALDYKPSSPYDYNKELDKTCTTGFGWFMFKNGTWGYGQGTTKVLIFCTTQLEQPTPEDAGCDDDDAVCYPVIANAQIWGDAQTSCKKFDANLASIHNKQENSYVRRQAVAKGAVNGIFIGASAQKDGTFKWIDGTKMDYENWAPGFPKKNFGDCIAMDTTTTAGLWMNLDCFTTLPAACIINESNSEPTCTGEDYEEGAVITSPGYPFSANTPCDYFLSVPAGKTIVINIQFLEANECCDVVYLYDAFLGGNKIRTLSGVVVNTTIISSTNLMRVSWKPDGGVNVRGLVMTYRAD